MQMLIMIMIMVIMMMIIMIMTKDSDYSDSRDGDNDGNNFYDDDINDIVDQLGVNQVPIVEMPKDFVISSITGKTDFKKSPRIDL